MQIWMTVSRARVEQHKDRMRGRKVKIRREQKECQKVEILKCREIEREKTNVSP